MAGTMGCGEGRRESTRPVILVGIDGASWNAIETLWERGQLPRLRTLARGGVTARLRPVAAASPVIWTSIATGVRPDRHGITNFVVPTADGDVPVSSSVRKVPAIWNILSMVGRRVAVLGWWASWPAEPVNGVVVSDRFVRGVADSVFPPSFSELLSQALAATSETVGPQHAIRRQDRAMATAATELARQDFDLLMVYLRDVDSESHRYWKFFQPPAGEEIDAAAAALHADRVPAAYRAVDEVLDQLLAAAAPATNVFVVSDHGFRNLKGEQHRIVLDLDRVLEHLGYLARDGDGIDWTRTRAVSWDSPPATRVKLVRLGLGDQTPAGPVDAAEEAELKARLQRDLEAVTYASGSQAFRIREPRADERRRGGDLTVVVRLSEPSTEISSRGVAIPGAIRGLYPISGTHDAATDGIFIAAGPDIDPTAVLDRIHSLDITPTLLFALALPVARDFDGQARTELFRPEFRARHPLQTIASWGSGAAASPRTSEADAELLEELRALGYLD